MNIDQAIERMTTIKDDIIYESRYAKHEGTKKDMLKNIEAIYILIACGRVVVKGGSKLV